MVYFFSCLYKLELRILLFSIGNLGSGSDYAGFLQRLGIPAVDVRYTYNSNAWKISSYPLYHSVYETYHLVSTFVDPDFNVRNKFDFV